MPNERKLRSKAGSKVDRTLFNFGNTNKLLFHNVKIKVDPGVSYDRLYESEHVDLPKAIHKSTNLVQNTAILPRKSKNKTDPLEDEVFEIYHKRMQKEEKRMSNLDKEKILSEVDKLNHQSKLLNQHDWMKHLPLITYITDPRDIQELQAKKKLTIKEIKSMISKYSNWKARDDKLSQSIKSFNNNHDDDPTDSEDEMLTIDELRKKRSMIRCLKHGPVIKLKIGEGLVLVIDPILPPKIVTTKKAMRITAEATIEFKSNHHLQHEKREETEKTPIYTESDRTCTNGSSLAYNPTNDIAFGQQIPEIRDRNFYFPSAWKTKYKRDNNDN